MSEPMAISNVKVIPVKEPEPLSGLSDPSGAPANAPRKSSKYRQVLPGRYWRPEAVTLIVRPQAVNSPTLATRGARVVNDFCRYRVLMLSGAVLASAAAGLAMAGLALAGPNGGTVVGGGATIQGQGSAAVTINQSSQNAIINWSTFNIGKGETTTFNQPNSTSIALNRVIGGQGPSYLDGTLTANGRVFVVNGDGIVFGPHSSINTAGFLATTNDIRNDDFMAGKYKFSIPGLPNASIVNLGSITAASGGFATLVAPGVRNAGTITATLGTVSLALSIRESTVAFDNWRWAGDGRARPSSFSLGSGSDLLWTRWRSRSGDRAQARSVTGRAGAARRAGRG
jgi:filamentous hemagglutinin family protein